jgi:hypothetical protein
MSLYALQVTSSDITVLQQGILFTTTSAADINNQVSAINAPNATETVATYANQLLADVVDTSQMAMGVTALMTNNNQPDASVDCRHIHDVRVSRIHGNGLNRAVGRQSLQLQVALLPVDSR